MGKDNKLRYDEGRREFFTKIAMASLACYIPISLGGCASDDTLFVGSGKAPFKVWEEMLQAVMTSPDYLPGEAERLIASKDPKAMYEFVKNQVILIPNRTHSLSKMHQEMRWGIEGVLQCGMATPREKVELLKMMLSKAGFNARIVTERTNFTIEEVRAFFLRPTRLEFAPKVSKKQLRNWKNEMGTVTKGDLPDLVTDFRDEASKISEKALEALQLEDEWGRAFDFRWGNYSSPAVEFETPEGLKYAHLFDPTVPYGSLKNPDAAIKDAPEPVLIEEMISVEVKYRTNVDTRNDQSLVAGKWPAAKLMGNQISLQFLNDLTPAELRTTTVNQLRTFIPSLAIQGGNINAIEEENRAIIGDPITIDGKKLVVAEDGEAPLHNRLFKSKSQPELQKQVKDLQVTARASSFPYVKLNIVARNAEGKLVEGLASNDFAILEDGIPVKAIMENNQRAPRVLVLSDTSGSMPAAYRGEGVVKFQKDLEGMIMEKFPATKIEFWETPSMLFTYLLRASRTDYDLVLFCTDGHNSDSLDENFLDVYKSGPPALILSVYEKDNRYYSATFEKMAEITNGKVLNAEDQEAVLQEVVSYIEALEPAPYSFTFCSAKNGTEHAAEIRIDEGRLHAEVRYQFPAIESGEIHGVIGVYLELKLGRDKTVKRTLAGWDPLYPYFPEQNQKNNRQVKQLFLGGAFICIEGAGPTLAYSLKNMLEAKLSNRKWGEALIDGKVLEARDYLSEGIINYPPELIILMAPLQDQVTSESLTFPTGFRIGLVKNMIGIDDQPSRFSFDYFPTSKFRSIASSPENAFKATVLKTAQLAAREAALYENSSWGLLKDSSWLSHSRITKDWIASIEATPLDPRKRFWYERILRGGSYYKVTDAAALSQAYLQIDKMTGDLLAMLPDGSGGGETNRDPTVDGMAAMIDVLMSITAIMSHLSSMFGFGFISPLGGMSLSIVAKYGVTLVKLYAIVSETILLMDASGLEESVRRELQVLACQVAKEITFSVTGNSGAIMGGLDNIIGAMVPEDDNPFSCN